MSDTDSDSVGHDTVADVVDLEAKANVVELVDGTEDSNVELKEDELGWSMFMLRYDHLGPIPTQEIVSKPAWTQNQPMC